MSSPYALLVSYPSTTPEGNPTKFDMDYYRNSHMSLIAQKWTPHKMLSWIIHSYSASDSLDGSTPPYCVQATVKFASKDDMMAALTQSGEETGKDVVNYTDVKPVISVSKVVQEEADAQGKGK